MGKTGKIGYKIKPEIDNTQVYCCRTASFRPKSDGTCGIIVTTYSLYSSAVVMTMFWRGGSPQANLGRSLQAGGALVLSSESILRYYVIPSKLQPCPSRHRGIAHDVCLCRC